MNAFIMAYKYTYRHRILESVRSVHQEEKKCPTNYSDNRHVISVVAAKQGVAWTAAVATRSFFPAVL